MSSEWTIGLYCQLRRVYRFDAIVLLVVVSRVPGAWCLRQCVIQFSTNNAIHLLFLNIVAGSVLAQWARMFVRLAFHRIASVCLPPFFFLSFLINRILNAEKCDAVEKHWIYVNGRQRWAPLCIRWTRKQHQSLQQEQPCGTTAGEKLITNAAAARSQRHKSNGNSCRCTKPTANK